MVDNKSIKRAVAELEALNCQVLVALKKERKTYWSIVKFESDENFNKGALWHLHVTFEGNPDPSQEKFITTVGLLSQDGPNEFLYKGSRFVLIGDDLKTVKAKGVVIDLI